jgi:hypothetical protein
LAARQLFKKFEVYHNTSAFHSWTAASKRDVSHKKKPGSLQPFFFN